MNRKQFIESYGATCKIGHGVGHLLMSQKDLLYLGFGMSMTMET